MRTRVVIEHGRVTFDVLDGQGEECRYKNASLYAAVRAKLGLPNSAVVECAKTEMLQPAPQAQSEGLALG